MGQHLVFLLHAPLGAMGGVAVGERRAGFDRPGKSAILGLVAAALGLDGRTKGRTGRSPTVMGSASARSRRAVCSSTITPRRHHRSARIGIS